MIAFLAVALAQLTSDRQALTQGVDSLIAPGALPGTVVASKSAFVVLTTGDHPTVIAGPIGSGRAMMLGHGGFFSAQSLANSSNHHFFENTLAWLGHKPLAGLRVGFLGFEDGVAEAKALGAAAVPLAKTDLSRSLANVDVLALDQGALDDDLPDQKAVMTWVSSGHGLLTAGPGWGWEQLHPGKTVRTDLSINRMLLPYGLGMSADTADGTPTVAKADDPLLQTESALAALRKRNLSDSEDSRAVGTVARALALSKLDDPNLPADIRHEAAEEGPTKWPITAKQPFKRLEAVLNFRAWMEEPSEKVTADPSAATFPGAIQAGAKRVKKSVMIDTSVPDWHGLGLYAPAGQLIKITLPAAAIGKGIGIRIGSDTDTLWDSAEWNRCPEISRRWDLDLATTTVSSPFGGTVFIDVPQNCKLGKVSVLVEGAVSAPRYVRGETTLKQWHDMMQQPGGPWVELEAHQIILSVPRWAVAKLDDPAPLMEYWDQVADLVYQLYAAPKRPRAERYSVDRQISVGYMHNGYPIMTFEDVATTFTDVVKLRSKEEPWGFYHELGHNFQEPAWTFDGTGEVTNNLFSLYGSQKINRLDHPGDMAVDKRDKRMRDYLAKGAHFEDWQNDPFLALVMYDQLREEFGWAPFTKVFGLYRTEHLNPQTELDKHDVWMVQMSKAVGRNLGPFFVAWGVPTSEKARASVKDLPDWMPKDWPAKPQ